MSGRDSISCTRMSHSMTGARRCRSRSGLQPSNACATPSTNRSDECRRRVSGYKVRFLVKWPGDSSHDPSTRARVYREVGPPMLRDVQSGETDRLTLHAIWDFNEALDFIWKAPRLIEALAGEEIAKDYFPDDPKGRALRALLESEKLLRTFPRLLAHGNLFSVCSLFESYVLRLSAAIDENGGPLLREFQGQGVARSFAQ